MGLGGGVTEAWVVEGGWGSLGAFGGGKRGVKSVSGGRSEEREEFWGS